MQKSPPLSRRGFLIPVVRPKGFEPLTFWSVVRETGFDALGVHNLSDLRALWDAADLIATKA